MLYYSASEMDLSACMICNGNGEGKFSSCCGRLICKNCESQQKQKEKCVNCNAVNSKGSAPPPQIIKNKHSFNTTYSTYTRNWFVVSSISGR